MQSVSELEVYQAGELSVLGFSGREILHELNLAECRDEISELVKNNNCHALAFDLTGVRTIPSGLLGILSCLVRQGLEVHLYNASDDIRDILEITHVNRFLHLHQIDV